MIELAIVNAGVNHAIGEGAEAENWDIAKAVLAVNLDGALATVAGAGRSHAVPFRFAEFRRYALRRYLRSFSTRVVRRMRSRRAAPATVPSASSSARRMSPISMADK